MRTTKQPTAKDCFTCGYAFLRGVLTDWYFFWPYLGVPLLLGELVLCLLMVHKVPYTKIDWDAYMEEVEGPLVHDNWNYTELKGDTGPLVYPAGFVWLYGVLRWIATGGYHTLYDSSVPLRSPLDATSIRVVQYIFVGMYVTTQGLVFNLYQRAASSRVPPWACVLLCVSKRMHSLYALRLFNDCWAMFFLYLAMHLFTCQKKWYKWPLGCIMFSIGVSIKMNVILFAPALWMLMIEDIGMYGSLHCIFMCALVQVVVGAPFLTANFWGYVGRSFELGRVFTFKWSVNYKFLPEDIFVSKQLAISLLLLHVVVLSCFFTRKKELVLVVGLLVCWFVGLLVCWFVGLLVCWFVSLLISVF
jgi:alpha-1,3-mannosyltransferase